MPSGLPPEAPPVARTSTTGPIDSAAAWAPPGAGPLEMAVAGVVVLSLVPFLWLMGRAMATTSLGNDELYTILQFSSRGPWVSWTDYHVPNNHVLFNLLNAVTPDTASLNSLRARFWSFVFTGVAILYVLGRSLA
jgi:hypothetical protein